MSGFTFVGCTRCWLECRQVVTWMAHPLTTIHTMLHQEYCPSFRSELGRRLFKSSLDNQASRRRFGYHMPLLAVHSDQLLSKQSWPSPSKPPMNTWSLSLVLLLCVHWPRILPMFWNFLPSSHQISNDTWFVGSLTVFYLLALPILQMRGARSSFLSWWLPTSRCCSSPHQIRFLDCFWDIDAELVRSDPVYWLNLCNQLASFLRV